MGFRYKPGVDILALLKEAGYSTYRLQKEGTLSSSVISKIKHGTMITLGQIDTVCRLLNCTPSDIIDYTKEDC